jgi:hypothetical protein
VTKDQKEGIEHALGFRSDGKGEDFEFCLSNIPDDEHSGIFDGLGELGKAMASRGKFVFVPSPQS